MFPIFVLWEKEWQRSGFLARTLGAWAYLLPYDCHELFVARRRRASLLPHYSSSLLLFSKVEAHQQCLGHRTCSDRSINRLLGPFALLPLPRHVWLDMVGQVSYPRIERSQIPEPGDALPSCVGRLPAADYSDAIGLIWLGEEEVYHVNYVQELEHLADIIKPPLLTVFGASMNPVILVRTTEAIYWWGIPSAQLLAAM